MHSISVLYIHVIISVLFSLCTAAPGTSPNNCDEEAKRIYLENMCVRFQTYMKVKSRSTGNDSLLIGVLEVN